MRILIAEDNLDNRDLLVRRFGRKGFETVLAGDGAEVIANASHGGIDLILMDISMPIMSGIEALRILKASPQTSKIPIIMLTAHAMPGVQDECRQAGCDDFLTKPIDFAALLTMIDRVALISANSTAA